MEFINFYTLLKKDTAKSFGFKSVTAANKDGINCDRVSFSIDELKRILKTDSYSAEKLIMQWRDNGFGTFSRVCGLYTFYISK